MKESPVFTAICEVIEETSSLNRIAARGTVRLVMKEVGLEVHDVTSREMLALLDERMPRALRACGVENVDRVIERARGAVKEAGTEREPDSAERFFDAIAGRTR
ncbi:MAG TPA: hypothetical protein DEP35_12195 [Deltaproteobacteria bacterium]|nr:hypothetical protein [Deltaproteobacteria bacterium]